MKLADRIFVQEAIELLGIQNKPIAYVIDSLINEENLDTYFDIEVDATEADGYYMVPIDEHGGVAPYVDGDPPTTIKGAGKKILEADVVSGGDVSVLRFEHEGTLYCGSDANGCYLSPIILRESDIYFDKSKFDPNQDIPAYQDKNHSCYAPELDLAIQLHKAIHIEKYGNQRLSREARISSWLNKNYPDKTFTTAAIGRLSAVIGIKK